jgi:hypothetical protein
MEKNIRTQGWTAMSQCLGGDELVWKVEDNGQYMPDIYPTEKDVWKSIADDQITMLQQVIDDEREPDEMDWEPQDYPAKIIIYTDGEMMVYQGDDDAPQPVLLTTLQQWRDNL